MSLWLVCTGVFCNIDIYGACGGIEVSVLMPIVVMCFLFTTSWLLVVL
jgi:hypothetical protein